MSSEDWRTVMLALIAFIGGPYLMFRLERIKSQGNRTEQKAEAVKSELKVATKDQNEKLDSLANVGDATHSLVNSNMGTQLELNLVTARRLAAVTGDPADAEIARKAEKALADHNSKQAKVDSRAEADLRRAVENV